MSFRVYKVPFLLGLKDSWRVPSITAIFYLTDPVNYSLTELWYYKICNKILLLALSYIYYVIRGVRKVSVSLLSKWIPITTRVWNICGPITRACYTEFFQLQLTCFNCCSSTVVPILPPPLLSPRWPTPTSHPQSDTPWALSMGPLYMFLDNASPSFCHYPPPFSPLVTVSLFFITMSLVIFCLLAFLFCWLGST